MEPFNSDHKFTVGDRVIIQNAYGGRACGPQWGTVTKVGRTLLHVTQDGFTRAEQYRMDQPYGRPSNTEMGHSRVFTPEEWDASRLRVQLTARLRELGWQTVTGLNKTSNRAMQEMIDVLLRDQEE